MEAYELESILRCYRSPGTTTVVFDFHGNRGAIHSYKNNALMPVCFGLNDKIRECLEYVFAWLWLPV